MTVLVVVTALLCVGFVLYAGPGFIIWSVSVVALGAGMQLLLHRRNVSYGTGSGRQETVIEVLRRGSFLRLYPPLPAAMALVATVIFMNVDSGFILAPFMIVMVGTAFWQARNRR